VSDERASTIPISNTSFSTGFWTTKDGYPETPEMIRLVPVTSFPCTGPGAELPLGIPPALSRARCRVFSLASSGHRASGEPSSRRIIQVALERAASQRNGCLSAGLIPCRSPKHRSVCDRGRGHCAARNATGARHGPGYRADYGQPTQRPFRSGSMAEELTMLAEAFSGMLVRLEDSFDRCQRCAKTLRTNYGLPSRT